MDRNSNRCPVVIRSAPRDPRFVCVAGNPVIIIGLFADKGTPLRKMRTHIYRLAILISLLILTGCGGLAGEPRIVSTSAVPTVTPAPPPDLGHPPARVNIERGAEIFGTSNSCATCHGIGGKGDGPVASSFACTLPDFTAVDSSRSKTIGAWFAIVSGGNGDTTASCLMPPWNGRLDEQQRWDVTSYIYSIHYTAQQITQGGTIWQDKCAACHGVTGKGDGPQAKTLARPLPNFSYPSTMLTYSDTYLFKTISNGLGSAMLAFQNSLTDDQRWAVAAYARSLSWDGVQAALGAAPGATQGATAATPEGTSGATPAVTPAAPESPTIAVSGKISNGTPGAAAFPAGQTVTLHLIDLSSGSPKDVQTLDAKTTQGGTFSFGEVKRELDLIYVATTAYAGLLQTSTPIRLAAGAGPTIDLSFDVYEATADPSVLQVELQTVFLSPFSPDTLLVREGLSFSNTSNSLFLNGPHSAGIALPAGATQIKLDPTIESQFDVQDGPNPVIVGKNPIYPGVQNALVVQFSYLLPFQSGQEIDLPTAYRIQSLSVHVPQSSGYAINDPGFAPGSAVTLQDGVYDTYDLQGGAQAGSVVRFSVKGADVQNSDRRNVLALVLAAAGLVLLVVGLAVWRLNRSEAPTTGSPVDSLIQAVANLDLRHEQGQIAQYDYETERERLKAEIKKSLE